MLFATRTLDSISLFCTNVANAWREAARLKRDIYG